MRVLLAHPGAELYGSDRVLLETAIALTEAGAEIVVALPSRGRLTDELRAHGCSVSEVPTLVVRRSLLTPRSLITLPVRMALATTTALRILRQERPDVVFVNTVTLPVWLLAARLARVPTVVHVHEAERDARAIVRRLLYAPARMASTVVANSEFTRSVIALTDRTTAARAVVIHNGVAGPQTMTEPREDATSGARLIYVGRLSPRKGSDLVIRATAELRQRGINVRTDMVGDVFEGYEWYRDELTTLTHDLELADVVTFTGFQTDVWGALADADIAIVPSRLEESFGNTAVEALLAGRAVIVSDRPGLTEAVSGSSAQVVPSDDAAAIAASVERLLRDWATARTHAIADARRASEVYAPARYRARIADVVVRAAHRGMAEPPRL